MAGYDIPTDSVLIRYAIYIFFENHFLSILFLEKDEILDWKKI